jgi:WD40 repeat protein
MVARVAETNALRQAYSASMLSACDALEHAQIDMARRYLSSAPAALRGWEWRHLSSRLDLSVRVHEHARSDGSPVQVVSDGRSYYDFSEEPTKGIRRWDTDTGQLLATIPTGHTCSQSWLVAGGKQLIAQILEGDRPEAVEVWDLERGTRLSTHAVPAFFQPAPDGSRIAYAWQQKIYIMDTKSGSTRVSPTALTSAAASGRGFFSFVTFLCFQPDGRRLAVGGMMGEVALLDTDSLEILSTFEAHKNIIWTMVFSPDSRLLATGSLDNTIRITDVTTNPPAAVATLRSHTAWVQGLCFSPDGLRLASCGKDRTLRLWDTRTWSPRGVFESDGVAPSFLPDSQTLINSNAKQVRFWDIQSSDARVLREHHSFVYPVLLSPDGATIYSGGWDGFAGQPGCLRFWDAATGDPIAAMGAADKTVTAAALSADGSRLAISAITTIIDTATINILDTATGTTVASFPENASSSLIYSLAFDPTAQSVTWIDSAQGAAHITNVRTGVIRNSRQVFVGIRGSRASSPMALSPDGASIAVLNAQEPTLDILDGQSLELVRQIPHGHSDQITSVAFSPDSRRILTTSLEGIVRVWDAASGTRLHDLVGDGNQVLCAEYSPDGKRIASGGRDNNVRIWDAETFEQVARLGGHEDFVYSLAWRADSQQLISGSGDYTVRIWDTQPLKDRLQARRERQAILAQVEPMVQRLFTELGDADKVVERVKADASLSTRARQVALQVTLRTSLDRLNTAARQPHP